MINPAITVYWQRLSPEGFAPVQKHDFDAGWDLTVSEDTFLPGEGVVTSVPTSIAVSIPAGWFGRLTGRSSTAKKYGLSVVESVIDAGFRGELFFQVINPGVDQRISRGKRLAQLLFLPVPRIRWVQAAELPPSSRDKQGFGSTGG